MASSTILPTTFVPTVRMRGQRRILPGLPYCGVYVGLGQAKAWWRNVTFSECSTEECERWIEFWNVAILVLQRSKP